MGLFLSFLLSFGTLGALDVTGLSINTETIVSDGFTILAKFMPLFLLCGSIAIVYFDHNCRIQTKSCSTKKTPDDDPEKKTSDADAAGDRPSEDP